MKSRHELEQDWLTREAAKYRTASLQERLEDFKATLNLTAALAPKELSNRRFPKTPADLPWWPPQEPLSLPRQ